MSWNYRVTRTRTPGTSGVLGEIEVHYGVREVHYGKDGAPTSWTAEVVGPRGDTAQECRTAHALMGEAFSRPVLDVTDEAHPFDVQEAADEQGADAPTLAQRGRDYLVWALHDALPLPHHEHLLAAREDVDPRDDFTCPLCAFITAVTDDLHEVNEVNDEVLAFAGQHPTVSTAEDFAALRSVAAGWLREALARFDVDRYEGLPSPTDLGITMRQAIVVAADKTNTPAEALARLWAGWTPHRVVGGARRNTTAVLSRDGHVVLVRMLTWDFWVYTVRDVAPAHWHRKTFEERLAILVDSVQTSRVATSVPELLDKAARRGGVTTKGTLYADRAHALVVRIVHEAFPDGQMPQA